MKANLMRYIVDFENFACSSDLIAVVGSHLYGTSTKTSDVDYRGFVIPPKDYLLGLKKFEQQEYREGEDAVIWSALKYFEILIKGNVNALEVLFANNIEHSPCGEMVVDNRDLFLSKHLIKSIKGFAYAEKLKAFKLKKIIDTGQSDKNDFIQKFFSAFEVSRVTRDYILDVISKETGKELKKTIDSDEILGELRQSSIDRCGYCAKNASHNIRLLEQGIELLTKGTLTFPRYNASTLLDIKLGNVPKEEVWAMTEAREKELDHALSFSVLPDKLDIKAIHELYHDMIARSGIL